MFVSRSQMIKNINYNVYMYIFIHIHSTYRIYVSTYKHIIKIDGWVDKKLVI